MTSLNFTGVIKLVSITFNGDMLEREEKKPWKYKLKICFTCLQGPINVTDKQKANLWSTKLN